MEKNLEGKIALVTGSSSGIGRGIAVELASRGATVIVTGRKKEKVEETLRQIKEVNGKAIGKVCDLSEKENIENFIEDIVKPLGIDIFVANAGITYVKPFIENTYDELVNLTKIDFLGTCYATQIIAKMMIEQGRGGNILFITSCNAYAILPNQTFYSSIKCALEGMTKGLSVELAKYNIRVNAVAPGAIESDLGGKPITDEDRAAVAAMCNVPRYGLPVDIAKAVAYMVSDDASYVSGTSLIVDGGLILRKG